MFDRLIARLHHPAGYVLIRADGKEHNKLNPGTPIPVDNLVILSDGRHFVRTWDLDRSGFAIYREGANTYAYGSQGE